MRQNNRRILNKAFFYLVILVVIGLGFASFVFTKSAIGKVSLSAPILAPIAVTKSTPTLTNDVNSNGVINPGDTLTYSITVANGATDATGVIFQDVLNSNLTLVPGSVNSSPIAKNEGYNALGNVRIQVPAASGVKVNDSDPDGTTPTITGFGNSLANANATAAAAAGASLQGGNVTLQSDGSFTYNPPAGYEGTDSFFYTLRDAGADGIANNADDATDTAQVTLTVSQMIWFVNNNAGACSSNCDGRLTNPFTTLAAFQALNNGTGNNPATNDHIFIYESGTAYTGGITLLNQQKLIGQDTASSLMSITGITPPQFSDPLPPTNTGNAAATVTIQNASGSAITLNSTGAAGVNVVRGLTASNSSASSILGNSFGTVLIDEVIINTNGQALNLTGGTIGGAGISSLTSTGGANNISLTTINGTLALGSGAISGATNAAFSISGGNVVVTYSGNISKTNVTAGALVSIASHTTGNITLSGLLDCSSACTGIAVSSTTSGTIEFSNAAKNINTGSNAAVNLTNNTGATINFTNGGLNIDTTSGAGFTATGGGTISITTGANANTIDTTTGTALNVANTTIGASGLTFRSISANGAANGIVLNSTGSSGSLNVTGDNALAVNATGGTIQSTTGRGISLTNTLNASFAHLSIQNIALSGIRGTLVNGFSLQYSTINNVNTNHTADDSNVAFNSTVTGTDKNITGAVTIANNVLNNSYQHGVDISQYDGTISSLNVSNNSFTSSSTTGNSFGSAVRLQILGSAGTAANLTKASINSNTVRNFPAGDAVIINAGNSVGALSASAGTVGSATDVIDIKSNDIQGFSSTTYMLNAIAVAVNKKGQGNFNIDSNGTAAVPMKFLGGNGVSCAAFGSVTVSCTINNNFMDLFNIASSAAINIGADSATANVFNETPNLTAIVTNNRVMHVDGNGIIATVKNTNGTGNFKIQNNNIDTPLDAPSPPYNPGFTHGIRVDSGVSTGGNANVCLNISGNTTAGGTTAGGTKAAGIGLRQEHSAGTNVFNIFGLSPNPSNDSQMIAYVSGNNPNSATGTAGTRVNSISSGATFGSCSLAIVAAADKESINQNDNVNAASNFPNFSIQSAEFLANIQPLFKHSAATETSKREESVVTDETFTIQEPVLNKQRVEEIANAESSYESNQTTKLSFLNQHNQNPSELLRSLQALNAQSGKMETILKQESVTAETTIKTDKTIKTQNISYTTPTKTFFDNALSFIPEIAGKISSVISPSVIAQEASLDSLKGQTKESLLAAPEAVETVCVDGNTDTSSCAGGFSIPANESTTITFRAVVNTSSTATSIPNTASAAGVNSNTVTTTIVQPPSIVKSFGNAFISVGGTSLLSFTITNPNPSTQLTGVTVTDVLPAGLSVANATTSVCGGTNNLVTTAATRTIALSATTIAQGGNCQFSVTVTGASEGVQNNLTGNVASNNGGQGNTASASITVINPPTLAKSFTPNQIQLNATSSLQFTLANPNTTLALNTLAFTDSLPAGVTAPNTAATTVCTDGSYSITNNVISFTKPSLAGGAANCVFSVTVTGTSVGVKMNQTSTVTTANSNAGAAATANLTVVAPPTIGKAFSPTSITAGGTSVVTLTLANSNTTGALTNASFIDTLANMSAVGGSVTGTCGASPNTLAAGATALSFSGITIPNNGSCTVIFSVTSSTVGVQPNTTSGVTTTQTATSGQASNTANLTVIAPTDLTIAKTHDGSFTQGDTAKTYSITVTNSGGIATSGTVSVVDTLPTGLTATSISGAGWTCTLASLTCTRSDALAASASYPAITLTVNVANNAPASVTNMATVSGGGETNTANNTALDATTVNAAATYSISGQVTNGGEGLSGVSVALSGGSSSTVTTDAAGNYSFSSLASGGNYTVTPTLNGYTFVQSSITINSLGSNQTNQNFATSTVSYEGDVVTRPTGDGSVDIFDLIATSNIIANQPGTTPLAGGGEYQRADTAPRSSKGDGSVDVQDLIQMGLYAAANNSLTPAGGPTTAAPPAMPIAVASKADTDQTGADRIDIDPVNTFINQPAAPVAGSATVSAGMVNSSAGSTAIIPVQLNSTNVGGVQFTVTYESAKLSIPSLAAVTDQATGTSFTFNNSTPGQLGVIAYRSTAGTAFPASTLLFNINFTVKAGAPAGASTISFGNTPVPIKASDPAAEAATIGTTSGAVTIVGSTAATVLVSGRVMTAKGSGITGVQISLIDSLGNVRMTLTKEGGYYRFEAVEAGSSYIITATGKRYTFNQPSQVLNVNEEIEEVNFIANPIKRLLL